MLLLAVVHPATAFETLRIVELYTNRDGSAQYIRLQEVAGWHYQCFLAGVQLVSIQGNTVRVFTFPYNLPSRITAERNVLIATAGFAKLRIVRPDYIVPAPFLFPDGGLLYFDGVDAVAYQALPIDGLSALSRGGVKIARTPVNFRGEDKFHVGTFSDINPPCW